MLFYWVNINIFIYAMHTFLNLTSFIYCYYYYILTCINSSRLSCSVFPSVVFLYNWYDIVINVSHIFLNVTFELLERSNVTITITLIRVYRVLLLMYTYTHWLPVPFLNPFSIWQEHSSIRYFSIGQVKYSIVMVLIRARLVLRKIFKGFLDIKYEGLSWRFAK